MYVFIFNIFFDFFGIIMIVIEIIVRMQWISSGFLSVDDNDDDFLNFYYCFPLLILWTEFELSGLKMCTNLIRRASFESVNSVNSQSSSGSVTSFQSNSMCQEKKIKKKSWVGLNIL